MTEQDVRSIMDRQAFPYETAGCQFIETHISWLILTDDYVYKFKRPVQYSFLDFTSGSERFRLLQKELELNRRLAPDIYLSILPVTESQGLPAITLEGAEPIDHVLLMRRMDESRQLDLLLEAGQVTQDDIIDIANVLIPFHQNAECIQSGDTSDVLWEEFADIRSVFQILHECFGHRVNAQLQRIIMDIRPMLQSLDDRLRTRHQKGHVIDGHGDLHSRNIMMMDPPIIFDCLEFSDDFRQLDLLSEIGFLCMDLERFNREDLSTAFLNHYLKSIPCIDGPEDELLFLFYKMHRAGVQLKVHALQYREMKNERQPVRQQILKIERFATLLRNYAHDIYKRRIR